MKKSLPLTMLIYVSLNLTAQVEKPDLRSLDKWQAVNRKVESINDNGKQGVRLNEVPGDGLLLLKGSAFSKGTIEFDVKGRNLTGQSFVGFAFHVQDEKTYDAIYFRPFNFMNPDTIRRHRAVQYISAPDYPWEKLRADYPGKYEKKVNPVPDPDGWFHVKLTVEDKKVRVYVNDSAKPSLEIEKLNNRSTGQIGFWVGNNSAGSFANLVLTPSK